MENETKTPEGKEMKSNEAVNTTEGNLLPEGENPKRYKYLNYMPPPVNLPHSLFDFVDEEEFCLRDHRIPVLIVVHNGIFSYPKHQGKKYYGNLAGLEHRTVGFIRKKYLSYIEYTGVIEIFLDDSTLRDIRNGTLRLQDLKT